MLVVEWTKDTFKDLQAIIDYIAEHNPLTAYDLEDHILKSAPKSLKTPNHNNVLNSLNVHHQLSLCSD